jgi:hypothetical protein
MWKDYVDPGFLNGDEDAVAAHSLAVQKPRLQAPGRGATHGSRLVYINDGGSCPISVEFERIIEQLKSKRRNPLMTESEVCLYST